MGETRCGSPETTARVERLPSVALARRRVRIGMCDDRRAAEGRSRLAQATASSAATSVSAVSASGEGIGWRTLATFTSHTRPSMRMMLMLM